MKLTGPLFSIFASGTLGSTVQFRQHSSGPIALQKPRPSKTIPPALRANAQILRIAHNLQKSADLHTYQPYTDYAKAHNITSTAAYLHFSLRNWSRFQALPTSDPNYQSLDTVDPVTLNWNILPDPGYDNIDIDPWDAQFITTLHVLSTISTTPGPTNCFHAHLQNDPKILVSKPDGMKSTYWIQGCTWDLDSIVPTLSNKLQVDV